MVRTNHNLSIFGKGLASLGDVAKQMLEVKQAPSIWLFKGDMGAGKTTLIKEICKLIGVVDSVNSPTFSIINEYYSTHNTVYHFDFYRVKTLAEALEAGVEDYFYSGNYCFIEWPEIIMEILPDQYLMVDIALGMGEKRTYKLSIHGNI